MPLDPLTVAIALAAVFERLQIRYAIGGAVASTILGEPRATLDLDLVVDIPPAQSNAVIASLEDAGFYVPREAALAAVRGRRSFNIVHREDAIKVDIFVAGRTVLDEEELERRQRIRVSSDEAVLLYVARAEDLILHKLMWFREGGETSDRQWRDILGLLKVQAPHLDWTLLERWAERLHVADLLRRARTEAGCE
jgi:hypothetical protein